MNEETLGPMTGVVKYFNAEKGFGFIRPDDAELDDVFCHTSEIEPWREGFKELIKGEQVKFELYRTQKGLQAKELEIKRRKQNLSDFPATTKGMAQ